MKTPQDTSIVANNDDKLKLALEQTNILAPLDTILKIGDIELRAILPKDIRYKSILAFTSPVVINDKTVIIDCRRGVRGTTPTTYDELPTLQLMYGALTAHWMSADWSKQITENNAIAKLYSYWVSDVIARQYGIGVDEKAVIGILAMAFYLSKSPIDKPFDDKARQIAQRKCGTCYNAVLVQQVVGSIPEKFTTYDDFVNALLPLISDGKLEGLTALSLLRHLSITVTGITQSHLLFGTAFEYPPCFNALLATIINNTFLQKSSPLGRMTSTVISKREGADLGLFLKRITGTVGKFA